MSLRRPIGIISDEIGCRLSEQLRWLNEHNVGVVQLRTVDGERVHEISEKRAEKVADALCLAGISVEALAAGVGKDDLTTKAGKARQLKALRQLKRLAPIFGTRKIRAFAGFREKDIQAHWEKHIIPFFQQALEALGNSCVLVIENEPATFCSTPLEVLALRQALLNDERIQALIDMGNLGFAPEIVRNFQLMHVDINDLVGMLTAHCRHIIGSIHVKNTTVNDALQSETVALNAGLIDFERHINHLIVDLKVDLPFIMEPHRPPKGEGAVLEEALRAMPGGEHYGNPAAAEEDLGILTEILDPAKYEESKIQQALERR